MSHDLAELVLQGLLGCVPCLVGFCGTDFSSSSSSFDPVQALLPESYHKVLLNIRKAEARNRKRQALKRAADSVEEDRPGKAKGDRYGCDISGA